MASSFWSDGTKRQLEVPQEGNDCDQQHKEGYGRLRVGDSHDHVIDDSPSIAGQEPEEHSGSYSYHHSREGDDQRQPGPYQHPAQHVPAEVVCTQDSDAFHWIDPNRLRQHILFPEVDGDGILGGKPGAEERPYHEGEHDGYADDAHAVHPHLPPHAHAVHAAPFGDGIECSCQLAHDATCAVSADLPQRRAGPLSGIRGPSGCQTAARPGKLRGSPGC